jgi:hypothetical protein
VAEDREGAVRSADSAARRDLAAAKGKLTDYFREVETEDRPADAEEEARLLAAITAAESAASKAASESRTTAAKEVRAEIEAERDSWIEAAVPRLIAELAPRAQRAKENIERTYAEHERASNEYVSVQRAAVRVALAAGLPVDDVPFHPDQGDDLAQITRTYLGGVELPLPRTLIGEQEAVSS